MKKLKLNAREELLLSTVGKIAAMKEFRARTESGLLEAKAAADEKLKEWDEAENGETRKALKKLLKLVEQTPFRNFLHHLIFDVAVLNWPSVKDLLKAHFPNYIEGN